MKHISDIIFQIIEKGMNMPKCIPKHFHS